MFPYTRAIFLSPLLATASDFIATLDPSLTFSLPLNFQQNASSSFLATNTSSPHETQQLAKAANHGAIAFSQEFIDLFPANASLQLVAEKKQPFAAEIGAWDCHRDQVWLTGPTINGTSHLEMLDLNSSVVSQPKTSIPVPNPNGGFYSDGIVYVASDGDYNIPPAIYSVNTTTLETKIVVNSYFGLRLNGPNDIAVVSKGGNKYLFFTDDPLSALYNNGQLPTLPDAVWRFDFNAQSLLPVIDRADISVANGIRANREGTKLYVTDTPDPLTTGVNGTASSAIYVFDLDVDAQPSNRKLFGFAERGISDGIHIDDAGRVWTGEADGIFVRSPQGRILGFVNAQAILSEEEMVQGYMLENFALAGNKLVVFAVDKIWVVELAKSVVAC
ncbi:hypothetical protein LTR56_007407 [Elasticomyces elasticus]|nr:hypothetical protein LTR56_007407 [Elasticomyces elasticus]KAK3668052.1 hypothetical protein LTR22_001120 [Elasticomyces elasticus]KAK4925200.1 hypothetical protein LTR49_007738 [Elasticomyces elasticus]KAK5767692.1 hypothetical protein LTS12_002194 [Elasticomyces elasticus]